MRELKFRVWNPEDSTISKVGALDWANGKLITANIWNNKMYKTGSEEYDFRIMQYTGLKDKNDVEIYEGDIIKAYKHNEQEFLREVIFRHGSFIFGSWWWHEFINIFRNIEVIGNIYENPELIK